MSAHPSEARSLQGAARLADWGVIRAAGEDAKTFLHGQLTQDVKQLSAAQARLAGYCSAKGRLLASFVVWQRGDAEVLLACSADLLAPTLKRLSMFVLRAKCKLSDATAEVPLYGLAGASATAAVGAEAPAAPWSKVSRGEADVIRLPDAAGTARYLWAGPGAPELPALPEDHWRWLEVQSGVPRIVAATVEQFVPQMVNLELVGGVNFQKGCYPGQEVVARSQYRGTLKRRSYLFETDAPVSPGQELFAESDPGQPAGLVAFAAPGPGGRYALLAETKIALAADPLHLGSVEGPRLLPAPLPYAFPAEA